MTKYVILGNGAAGIEAALSIRSHDENGSITLITESKYLHYNRPKLIHFIAGNQETNVGKLVVYDEDFYKEKKIENILLRKIIALDTDLQYVFDNHGGIHGYDKLLIATGSKPLVPPIEGVKRAGVFTLRSATDAQKILRYSSITKNIVVVGGGLLGLENAWSLRQLGKEVHVIEGATYLLPRQLDEAGGKHLQSKLEEKGISFSLGSNVKEIEGKGKAGPVQSILLSNGERVEADCVLLSIGVRGDIGFVKDAGLETNRGVIVNDYLETNIKNVWAAGDVAEHRQTLYGLWTVAKEQGKIAGLNMAGIKTAYEGSIPSTLLKITGISVFSMGDIANPGNEVLDTSDTDSYRKMTFDEGKAKSAMIIGDMKAIQEAQKMMKRS